MASKIFDTQQWRIICDTEEDQTTATDLKILASQPDGSEVEFNATLDSDVNKIYYDVDVSELTQLGNYKIWPRTSISSRIAPGDPQIVTIYKEGT